MSPFSQAPLPSTIWITFLAPANSPSSHNTCSSRRSALQPPKRCASQACACTSKPRKRPLRAWQTPSHSIISNGLVYPRFACPVNKVRTEVSSMPGIFQQSPDQIVEECREVAGLGIPAVILFGLPEKKDETGSEAASATGAVQRSIEAIRKAKLDLIVITDFCLCEYTSHGHCGIIKDGEILNDPSVALLADAALSHARGGGDIAAPSDMMDGRVAAIRHKLDENKFSDVAILS